MVISEQGALTAPNSHSAEDAFAAFAATRLDHSYRMARLIMRDDQEAQDATHDAFVAAWRNRRRLRDPQRVDAWFSRILVNACRQRLRRGARLPTVALADDPLMPGTDSYRHIDDRDAIARAFVTLNAEQRIVVILRFYRDLTVREIADLMGSPPGTVKSRLHHAMSKLRTAVESGGPEVT